MERLRLSGIALRSQSNLRRGQVSIQSFRHKLEDTIGNDGDATGQTEGAVSFNAL
jgi:hypothetical protein